LEYFLRFYYASWLYVLIPFVLLVAFLKYKWAKGTLYRYSLSGEIKKNNFASRHPYKKILNTLKFLSLIVLAFLVAKPQLVDPRSNVIVEGIDMMLVLDVSASMEQSLEGQSRIDVAKKEAIRFIEKREHDPIGLVIFGRYSVSRCPITLDKNILKTIVNDLHIGVVDPRATVLSMGILTAANRLKDSQSKNKIMIVLTDGAPTMGVDVSPNTAIDVAKKLGIKIYTVGIGIEEKDVAHLSRDKRYYLRVNNFFVDTKLLKKISSETGGKFFMAKNPQDMRNIYEAIDKLEKTEYETNIYSKYFDVFMPFLWTIFIILLFELFLSTFIWFGISL